MNNTRVRLGWATAVAWTMMQGCAVGGGGGEIAFDDGAPGETTNAPGDAEGSSDTSGAGSSSESSGDSTGTGDAADHVEEAKLEFATYADLHGKVIQRTCTPNDNVCHNNKEYPDLETPQGMLDRLGQRCNIVELYDEPEAMFNGCEPVGDTVRFVDGGNLGWATEVAFIELEEDASGTVISGHVHLRDIIGAPMQTPGVEEGMIIERNAGGQMLSVGLLEGFVSYTAGTDVVHVTRYVDLTDAQRTLLEVGILPGDPNRDGVFGATDGGAMQEIKPGDPWQSYLLQRLQGTVPGSPMPLANQPLSAAEVIALACWIEGLDVPGNAAVDSAIDYDGCQYAAEYAEPPAGAGATLSEHVQPIFDQYCSAGGCHGALAPAAGLDLTPGNARQSLLADAQQQPGIPRVTPLNPTNSYLVAKLEGSDAILGVRMPVSAPLPESDLEIIRTWIIQGAPDN